MNHRLDGVLWQRSGEYGTQEQPVVLRGCSCTPSLGSSTDWALIRSAFSSFTPLLSWDYPDSVAPTRLAGVSDLAEPIHMSHLSSKPSRR